MLEVSAMYAVIVLFIHATTWDDMINSWIKKIIKPTWIISKPIYGCPICMGPWYGSAMYLLMFKFGSWQELLLVAGMTGGLGVVSVLLIDAKDYFVSRTFEHNNDTEDDCCS